MTSAPEDPVKSQLRFLLTPECFTREVVAFPPATQRQMARVLRLRPGTRVIALDGSGLEYLVELTGHREAPGGRIVQVRDVQAEPGSDVRLFQAVLRPTRFELLLEKCTEIGISSITPIRCERSARWGITPTRTARYQRIIGEAVEQSRRAKAPQVGRLTTFDEAIGVEGANVLLDPSGESLDRVWLRLELSLQLDPGGPAVDKTEGSRSPGPASRGVNLFVGPEGGFSEAELEAAETHQLQKLSLGPRILRSETAAVVATALILDRLKELEPRRPPEQEYR